MSKPPAQMQPCPFEAADIEAFRALERGDCPAHLQKRALGWIINVAAATYDVSFSPESDRLTSFAEGRRFVGLQVLKLLKLNPQAFTKKD
jgi:hypothetical protein